MLNDLLDPARANLKLREDPSKGFFVENIKEETLVSVEHALSVIAAGDAHRKVSTSLLCQKAWTKDSIRSLFWVRMLSNVLDIPSYRNWGIFSQSDI